MLKRFEPVLSRPRETIGGQTAIFCRNAKCPDVENFFETEEYGLQQVVHFRNSCIPPGYACTLMREGYEYEQPGTD